MNWLELIAAFNNSYKNFPCSTQCLKVKVTFGRRGVTTRDTCVTQASFKTTKSRFLVQVHCMYNIITIAVCIINSKMKKVKQIELFST